MTESTQAALYRECDCPEHKGQPCGSTGCPCADHVFGPGHCEGARPMAQTPLLEVHHVTEMLQYYDSLYS